MQHDLVKLYYGEVLKTSADLRTSACCTADAMPAHLRALERRLHREVTERYYGCGLVAPAELEGRRVLDLGAGAGRDVYLLSQLVGPRGHVVGVDMTEEQLEVARRHVEEHTRAFGYESPNVSFRRGYIERLDELDLAAGSFDVIVSNCVVNLSPDKPAVLRGAHAMLAPGGEMYFSDVYCDRRLDPALQTDPELLGECLAGAMYWNDFLSLARRAGFLDPRLVSSRPLEVTDEALRARLGAARFFSATYRLFKLDALEPACEDYGQAVIYRGGVAHEPDVFVLDGHHAIERGRVFPVCGNTWRMLAETRFARHVTFLGDFSTHYGIFPGCGTNLPFATSGAAPATGSCC